MIFHLHAELLGIDDMREVHDLFWDVRAEWKNIGLALGIDAGTLASIERTNRTVVEDCFYALLECWLQHDNPKPTRSAMTEVLHSKPLVSALSSGKGEYLLPVLKFNIMTLCCDKLAVVRPTPQCDESLNISFKCLSR